MSAKSQRFFQTHQKVLPYEKNLGADVIKPIEFLESGIPGDGVVAEAIDAGTLIEFVPMHIKNPPRITFMAFIKTQKDSFKPMYDSIQVFGRAEPYYVWKSSARTITLTLEIPSSGKDMALKNLVNLQWLLASLYPAYKGTTESNSVSASPLFRVKYSNMIMSAENQNGLLAVLQNVTVTPVVKSGYMAFNLDEVVAMTHGNLISGEGIDAPRFQNMLGSDVTRPHRLLIPVQYTLSCTLNVVLEHSLGWEHETGDWLAGSSVGFPYGIGLDKQKGGVDMSVFADAWAKLYGPDPGRNELPCVNEECNDLNANASPDGVDQAPSTMVDDAATSKAMGT